MAMRQLLAKSATALLFAAFTCASATAQTSCRNNTAQFGSWLAAFKQEALAKGISAATLAAAAPDMTFDQAIVNRDRGQGVFGQTFLQFSDRMVAQYRLQHGANNIKKYAATFQRIEQQFGVPAAVIVAFWGLETDFGANIGNLPTLRSLTTLAFDCRRPDLFREQLLYALRIVQRGDLRPDQMVGPFAGELGQLQFLPAHYFDHGVDFDGDGRRDLLRSTPDALASAGKYLAHVGWKRGQPWLEEVRVPAQLPWDHADLSIKHPRAHWARLGVTRAGGRQLPADNVQASLLLPMGRLGPAFLAYDNFHAFLEWNQSLVYSTTVAYFATRLAGAPAVGRGNGQVPAISVGEIRELQRALLKRGYKIGQADGKLGLQTRGAVKAEQMKLGVPADAYPSPELLALLRAGR
jgi:lytic murein transglycosylase